MTRSQNDCITGEIPYAQTTWFTKPNHDLAFVRVLGIGKSWIAVQIWSDGRIPEDVIFKPANST